MSIVVVSPRDLVLRNGRNAAKPVTPVDIKPKADLGQGNQQLHSFYRPGLLAGTYAIDVRQDIAKKFDGTGEALEPVTDEKRFTVIAPQYFLPPGSLNSVYPPNGHTAPHVTLPHVVLNDPQLPWERAASEKELSSGGDNLRKHRTPWLAVLVFSHEEIALSPELVANLKDLLKLEKLEPTPTSSLNVNISDFVNGIVGHSTFSSPLAFNKDLDDPKSTFGEVVFLKRDLLQGLLATYNSKGELDPAQNQHDVSRYQWLSHVRQVDTTGMAEAGSTIGLLGERDSLFSVIFSHRTGPLDIDRPTPVIAHLVSIEGLENMPYPFTTEYIGLSSLHSWTYTSLPPNSLTVHDAFEIVGNSKNMLRAPVTDAELKTLNAQGKPGETVANRLYDGYSLTRYRTQTGETTAAFYRGPLTPTNVPYPLRPGWGDPSTHSTDRQIFDRQVGMMDISYSAAWQLGKTMALADRPFTIALARVRKQIQEAGVEEKKKEEMKDKTLFQTKMATVESLATTMKVLEALPQSNALLKSDVSNRWQSQAPPQVNVSFQTLSQNGEDKEKLQNYLDKAAEKISGTLSDPSVPYDEFNTPYSTDWMAVLKWVLDRKYLAGIPPHYLISDPSHLPQETIRFFAIDQNWTDALIDGALSLANHLDRDDDQVRTAIQHAVKKYLDIPSQGLGQKPPVPQYGFLLRSELVTKFPDMVITTEPSVPKEEQQKPILIRHELLDNTVMLCLFDRPPAKNKFESVTLGQPPHQQSFSIGSELQSMDLKIDLAGVYTGEVKDQPSGDKRIRNLPGDSFEWTKGEVATDDKPAVFVWGNERSDKRFLLTNNFAPFVHRKVTEGMNADGVVRYAEPEPSASMVGYQLNDPTWQLKIVFKDPKTKPADSKSDPPPAVENKVTKKLVANMPIILARMVAEQPRFPKQTLLSTGRLQRSKPLVLDQPPPNALVLPETVVSAPRVSKMAARQVPAGLTKSSVLAARNSSSVPALEPEYIFSVFSLGETDLKPSLDPQDLIFSITISPESQPSAWKLEYISISIPFQGTNNEPEILMSDYQGSGGIMITNLRFNVVSRLIKEGALKSSKKSLKVDLLPRTHLQMVPVGQCEDLTFLLASVIVEKIKVYKECKLTAKIKYAEKPEIEKNISIQRP